MTFPWMNSLETAFSPHAGHPRTTLDEDQKKFWHALQTENIAVVGEIAEKYPQDYMKWESREGPPLKTAQAWGCFESFVELMSLGADKNTDYGNGWTPILTALRGDDRFFIEYIIEHKPNLDGVAHDDSGRAYTALQLAIDNKNIDAVKMLIERGANDKLEIETRDGVKMLPADYARAKHQQKIAELIDLAPQVKELYDKQRVSFLDAQLVKPDAPAVPPPAP